MFKILRIACSVIAAVLVTACIFLGIFIDIVACLACAAGALLFFVLTMLFKYLQEERENKDCPEQTGGDRKEKGGEEKTRTYSGVWRPDQGAPRALLYNYYLYVARARLTRARR